MPNWRRIVYFPLALGLTLLEMVSDPVAFFDPTKEAPSGHISELETSGFSGPDDFANEQRG